MKTWKPLVLALALAALSFTLAGCEDDDYGADAKTVDASVYQDLISQD